MMILYHTGFEIIRCPDVLLGRRNADFGQGFYLTEHAEFAHRWARERKGKQTIVNSYELDPEGLTIHRFQRDLEWFDYIYGNRSGRPDPLSADVILGPIANDTIYDSYGITTSGFLKPEDALRLQQIGPEYHQIAIKTVRAAERLKWRGFEALSPEKLAEYRTLVAAEEDAYQSLFVRELEAITAALPDDLERPL